MRTVFSPNNEVLFQKACYRLFDAGIPTIPPIAFLPWQMMPPSSSLFPWERLWYWEPIYRQKKTLGMFGQLYICLDWQYDDAVNLLRDPNYIVKNPVNIEEFENILGQFAAEYEKVLKASEEKILKWCFALDTFFVGVIGILKTLINLIGY